tara:strand:- start:250 stop:459 length:210 start_codon:yes stop_codon:yes gene_type:complete
MSKFTKVFRTVADVGIVVFTAEGTDILTYRTAHIVTSGPGSMFTTVDAIRGVADVTAAWNTSVAFDPKG